jgi:hypothetical protein
VVAIALRGVDYVEAEGSGSTKWLVDLLSAAPSPLAVELLGPGKILSASVEGAVVVLAVLACSPLRWHAEAGSRVPDSAELVSDVEHPAGRYPWLTCHRR